MKTHYTSAFKAQVIIELLKEEKTPSQIAAEYKVHPKVLRDWKALALKGLPSLFEKRHDLVAVQAAHAQQLEDLYAQIGRLTTQLGGIKKKSGIDPDKS